jgi:ElaB/YqjD/DUF883 family membrane-anchored ribosome-binding protein
MLASKLREKKPMTNQRTDYHHESDHPSDLAVSATDRLKEAGERAQEMAQEVAEQARRHGQKAEGAAREFRPFVERSLKEQTMATLAAAAIIGFVLGALSKK